MTYPKNIATRWYTSPHLNMVSNNTVTSWAAEMALFCPIRIYRNGTIEAMGLYKTNTTNLADVFRLGIYTSDSGYPDALVLDFGTVSFGTASVGVISTAAGVATVTPGTYWMCVRLDTLASGTHATSVKHGASSAHHFGTRPQGYSGTAATDFGSDFNEMPAVTHTTSSGTGSLSSDVSASSFANGFTLSVAPFYTFEAAPDGSAGWAWHGANPYWQDLGGAE